ncbi:DUF5677 domain-containing protein [Pandoraea terrae]|nr:DUF5677 domain-containing protein [Pandoraea terrae]
MPGHIGRAAVHAALEVTLTDSMNEQSRLILDRQAPAKVIETHLGQQCDMIRELADYGADLICSAYAHSPRQLTDAIALGVLLKQVVAMVDAADALIRIGAIHSAHLQARAACEASFYLEWMLSSDSENKAKHYYVASLRDQKQWAIRASSGTPENKRFVDSLAQAGIDDSWTSEMNPDETATYLERVNAILAQPELAGIQESFEKYTKKYRRPAQWYQPMGFKSIADIASALSRKYEYIIFYSKGSNVVHSGSHFDHIAFSKSNVRFKGIRSVDNCKESIMHLVQIAMRSYRAVNQRYIPEDEQALGRLWIERWRAPFFSMPDFEFETK